jgi:hypothetical protein
MKRLLLSLLFGIWILSVFGNPVDSKYAEKIAKNLYFERVNEFHEISLKSIKTDLVFTEIQNNSKLYYVFDIDCSVDGYVIISADDDVFPVLGYSFEGNYMLENQPTNFREIMIIYEKQILEVISKGLKADRAIQNEWARLENQTIYRGTYRSVSPLVTAHWAQGQYYNKSCPYDASSSYDNRVLVGCVAVAMGQVMHYHKSPTTGSSSSSYYHNDYGSLSANYGMTTYNWSGMPNSLSTYNSSVATLLYHCGVSVEMNYGITGSGAYTSDAATALKSYFGYASSTTYQDKGNFTTSGWESLLKTELDNNRPMVYRGHGSSGGHAFVCDGYQGTSNNHFHFNWGWGGSQDGYFYVSNLNPGTYDFSTSQAAITGIVPGNTSNVELSLYDAISVSPTTLTQYQSATVWVQHWNTGTTNFTGDLRVALYSTSGQFVELIDSFNNVGLQSGYYYTYGIDFETSSINASPGTYLVAAEYKPSGGSWTLLKEGSYSNPVTVTIQGGTSTYDMRLYDSLFVYPKPIVQNDSCFVWMDIANYGSSAFSGDLTVSLFDASSGQFVEEIETRTGLSLNSMSHWTNGIWFVSGSIQASPGDYLLAAHFKPSNGNWTLVDEDMYLNPISVKVISKAQMPDPYEVNNTQTTSYAFTPSFVGNAATISTDSSNFHNETDIDYYKIDLASGYNYTISMRLHDNYNSGNGKTYSCDAVFAYKYGANWSAYFDDEEASDFVATDGGTVYFEVSPYFAGVEGTYLLEVEISRVQAGDPDLVVINEVASPTTIQSGENITVSCDVKNVGSSASSSSVIKYYLSSNSSYDAGDVEMGFDNVISLAKDGSTTVAEEFQIPVSTSAGQWYILFYADANQSVTEDNENNNIGVQQISVFKGEPDLIIQSKSLNPATISVGGAVNATCTIKNQGEDDASACVLKYYLSDNTNLDGADIELGSDNILGLTPASSSASSENLIIPSNTANGTWYILFEIDANHQVTESDESNNVEYSILNVTGNTGVQQANSLESAIRIFPNPASNILSIHFENAVENIQGQLIDFSGKIVYHFDARQITQKSIDISKLPSGLYHIRLTADHQMYEYSFVKE